MSERLQGHRTKLNANKMTCDGGVQVFTCFWLHVNVTPSDTHFDT